LSNGGFLAHRNPKEREDNQPPTPKKLRETVRAFLTPSQAGVVFPTPPGADPDPETGIACLSDTFY
jgi:hypothetical protein